ncbi:hypothetical protein [Pseudonocardia xishanensis]|uniref:Uncharacterized protein n=1 Tax=Pseudonocardia xishanensis TaxID=630995 RepID=A0ABP8RUB7_9PSEU
MSEHIESEHIESDHTGPGRLARLARVVGTGAGTLLCVVGVLAYPAVVLTIWALAVLLVGPAAAVLVHGTGRGGRVAVRCGTAATAVLMAAGGAVAGLVAVLGAAAVPVVLVALGGGAFRVWRRRAVWGRRVRGLLTPAAMAVEVVPAEVHLRQVRPGSVSTLALCVAWQRSYGLISDPRVRDRRGEVAAMRQTLLDELERRDPQGFRRWLDTEPRPDGDPRRYLTTER